MPCHHGGWWWKRGGSDGYIGTTALCCFAVPSPQNETKYERVDGCVRRKPHRSRSVHEVDGPLDAARKWHETEDLLLALPTSVPGDDLSVVP